MLDSKVLARHRSSLAGIKILLIPRQNARKEPYCVELVITLNHRLKIVIRKELCKEYDGKKRGGRGCRPGKKRDWPEKNSFFMIRVVEIMLVKSMNRRPQRMIFRTFEG